MRYRKIVALHSIHDFDRLLYYTEGYNPHGIKAESIEVTDGSTMFQEVTNGHDLTVIGNIHKIWNCWRKTNDTSI